MVPFNQCSLKVIYIMSVTSFKGRTETNVLQCKICTLQEFSSLQPLVNPFTKLINIVENYFSCKQWRLVETFFQNGWILLDIFWGWILLDTFWSLTDRNSVGSVLILSTTTTCPSTRVGISSTWLGGIMMCWWRADCYQMYYLI